MKDNKKVRAKKKFVILCFPRTGSYHLCDIINQQKNVSCYTELFKPDWVELNERLSIQTGYNNNDTRKRDSDPFRFYQKVCEASDGDHVGFKIFPSHNPRMLTYLLHRRQIKKVFLSRNPIQSFISLLMANKTGKWTKRKNTPAITKKTKVEAPIKQLINHVLHQKIFYERLRMVSQLTGQSFFLMDYSQVKEPRILSDLASYLEIGRWLNDLVETYHKQIKDSYLEIVDNYENIEKFCDLFNVNLEMSFYEFMGKMNNKLHYTFE